MITDMKEALAKQEAQKTAPYVRDGVKGIAHKKSFENFLKFRIKNELKSRGQIFARL